MSLDKSTEITEIPAIVDWKSNLLSAIELAKKDNVISTWELNSLFRKFEWDLDSLLSEIDKNKDYIYWISIASLHNLIKEYSSRESSNLYKKHPVKVLENHDLSESDSQYIVKKWDTLWKIVKREYWLLNNRDIANAINYIVKYNSNKTLKSYDFPPPDWIKWDLIFVWNIIYLPKKIKNT